MRIRTFARCLVSFFPCLWLMAGMTASAAPGAVDPLFNAVVPGSGVRAVAVQPDGKILVAGQASWTGTVPAGGLIRLFPDGKIDPSYTPVASLYVAGLHTTTVDRLLVQKDGKLLASGLIFTSELNGQFGQARQTFRFNPDGSLDTEFSDNFPADVLIREVLADGKFLGTMDAVGGSQLVRLNANGSIDVTFPPVFNSEILAVGALADGRTMVGGGFTDVAGTPQDYLIRLDATGTLDTTFNANASASADNIVAQPDGKLLVTGGSNLIRRLPNGPVDPTFTATVGGVKNLNLQADGKILLICNFAPVSGGASAGVVRITAAGAADATFQPYGTGSLWDGALAMQVDGRILAGVGSTVVRLENDAATSTLAKDATAVTWLRGGAAPELGDVTFEYRDGTAGNPWLPLGNGSRIAGGWSVSSASLAANGVIRASGIPRRANRVGGMEHRLLAFGNAAPAMEVKSPAGTSVANDATVDCGSVLLGYDTVKYFSIGNTGTGVLDGLSLAISGANASQFSVVEFSPGQLGPQSATSFGVRFSSVGTIAPRSAVLTISSNNPAGAFTVNLTASVSTEFSPHFASAKDVPLTTTTFTAAGKTFGTFSLGFAPPPGTILTAINQTTQYDPITGTFPDLADGSLVSATYGGQTYVFLAGYSGRTGNDLTLTLSGAGTPRSDFAPTFPSNVTALAVSPARRIMVFRQSFGMSLIKDDGTPVNFAPSFMYDENNSGYATNVIACPDGKFLVAGRFTTVNKVSRNMLVRFDSNGYVDPSFNANLGVETVNAMSVQSDGKILLGGGFTYNSAVRLNPDGSLDPSFSVTLDGGVGTMTQLSDGKILMVGGFTTVNGISRKRVARLNPDGGLDASFQFNSDSEVGNIGAFAEQKDGNLVIADSAGMSNTSLRRINRDGSYDATFAPRFSASPTFNSIAIQADGKILVGGYFSEVNYEFRKSLVRFNPDGTVDPTFACDCSEVRSLVLLGNGELLINGGVVAGTAHPGLAQLMNDSAALTLEVPNTATVRLMTGGTAPELRQVTFDMLASGATDWVRLTTPDSIPGGWSLAGQTLPAAGIVRGRAIPSWSSGSSSVIEGYKNFGTAIPNIQLAGPAGNVLGSGAGGVDFGPVLTGFNRILKIRVTNHGDGAWENFVPAISGANAGSFTVVSVPERLVLPGETGTFEIRFTPSAAGTETANLTLTSNDAAHSPFQIPLAGSGGNVFSPVFHEADDVALSAAAFTTSGRQFGTLGLTFAPAPGTKLLAVRNSGTAAISGRFSDLADGSVVSATFGGNTYQFIAGYAGGDGNDLVLSLIGPGILDLSSQATVVSSAVTVAVPIDGGETLIAGSFTTVNGVTRNRLARLKADGGLDADFNPNVDASVEAVHRFTNGDLLIAGNFTSIGGTTTGRVARLKADGSPDPMFLAAPDAIVKAMAIQQDGKILIGGDFLKVNGVTRNRIARLNSDGSLDTGFNPNASGSVACFALQDDGKILMCGGFTTVGGTSRPYVARLETSGTLDPTFAPAIAYPLGIASVSTLHVQPDGNILIAGIFSKINGVSCASIGRVTPTGATDATFTGAVTGSVLAINRQADGKLLIGGTFTAVNDVARNRFAVLNADGTLDPVMNPDFGGTSVSNIALRQDGRILAGGPFTTVNGVARGGFARLLNDATTSSLENVGSSTVRWMRGGTFPTESKVVFEIHKPGETGWQNLGNAMRIDGGWQLAGLTLPASAVIRALSTVTIDNASYPHAVVFPAFGSATPVLTVRDGAGTLLQSSVSQASFGGIPISMTRDLDLQLANEGLTDLQGITTSITGPAAVDFSVTVAPGVSLSATGIAKIRVRFAPSLVGTRTAELRIASNDPGANPFVVGLVGTGGSVFSPEFYNGDETPLSAASVDFTGKSFGSLVLRFLPPDGTAVVAANNTGTSPISGVLAGLPAQSYVTADFAGQTYQFLATYRGGDGNDLAFIRVAPGVADPAFDPKPNSQVWSFGLQPDGKTIAAGDFTTLGGVPKLRIARFHPDGTVDPAFNHSTSNRAEGLAVQKDGKVLVCSSLTDPNGTVRTRLARLNADGSLDVSFAPQITGTIYKATELASGKILIGGSFSKVGTVSKSNIALLNADGTLETAFTASTNGTTPVISAFAEQADGKILIGGTFTSVNSTTRNYLARLNPTGTLDTAFNAVLAGPASATISVSCLALQPDGRILVGGNFTSVSGVPRNRLVRLNQDATLDTGFYSNFDNSPSAILVQVDGKVIISGTFDKVNGVRRGGIARLNRDGSLDAGFNPRPQYPATPAIYSMVMQADGTLWVGGNFTAVNGIGSGRLAKLTTGPVSSGLESVNASTLSWSRSGGLAELQEASFEISENGGATWTALGMGTRTPTGWTLGGLTLPAQGHIRAAGHEILSNSSSALVRQTQLFGRSATAIEQWRAQQFDTPLSEGAASDSADPDLDGLGNLMEFALGLNPKQGSSGYLPAWTQVDGVYQIEFAKPAGVAGVTYGAEWTESLTGGDWHPAENLGTGGWQIFRVPSAGRPNLFFRMKVTNP